MKKNDLIFLLIAIYVFVDSFLKEIVLLLLPALKQPGKGNPPIKKHNLSLAELITLALFRFFVGYTNWQDFYNHIHTYHRQDFPNLPDYSNFVRAMNKLSFFGAVMLQSLMNFFRNIPEINHIVFPDSSQLHVCSNKREFTHKVCKRIAAKGKSSLGWFYGFKLHIVCNKLMQILDFRILPGNIGDRQGLEMMWSHIFGLIVADAGYLGKEFGEKAQRLGKKILTGVKKNMKKLMTNMQHTLLKMRQIVETVFSVLKHRMGMENTLPRSELGHFAHYIWCLTAYQLEQYWKFIFSKPLLA
jgi:hypothetical protein